MMECRSGRTDLELQIVQTGALAGTLQGESASQLSTITVVIRPNDRTSSPTAAALPLIVREVGIVDRSFIVKELDAGSYEVIVACTGHVPRRMGAVTIQAGQTWNLEPVVFEGGGQIRGSVRFADGTPATAVHVVTRLSEVGHIFGKPGLFERSGVSREDGTFEIKDVPRGSVRILASCAGYYSRDSIEVVLGNTDKATTVEDIILAKAATIKGRLVSVEGAAVRRGKIIVIDGNAEDLQVEVDADGGFCIDGIRPGNVEVRGSSDSGRRRSDPLTLHLREGETAELEITIK